MSQKIELENDRGQQLVGQLDLSSEDSCRLVIACHGFTGDKSETKELIQPLNEADISLLRFDFRGSGESDGSFKEMTIASEVADLRCMLSWARREGFESIGIFAHSLGGSIATLGCQQDIKAMVLVSPSFEPFRTLGSRFSEQKKKLEAGKTVTFEVEGEKWELGPEFWFELKHLQIKESLKEIDCPLRIIHGDEDEEVPLKFSKEVYNLIKSEKDLQVIENADHDYQRMEVQKKPLNLTVDWFQRHL